MDSPDSSRLLREEKEKRVTFKSVTLMSTLGIEKEERSCHDNTAGFPNFDNYHVCAADTLLKENVKTSVICGCGAKIIDMVYEKRFWSQWCTF